MKVAVQDCEGWYKDDITGAAQCADTKKYNDYMRSYRARKRKDRDFDTLQNEVTSSATADDVALISQRLGYSFSGDDLLRFNGQKVDKVTVRKVDHPGEYH